MRILIIGAGGHAQVTADILLRARERGEPCELLGYLDDNPALVGRRLLDLPVIGPIADLAGLDHDAVIVAIGANQVRRSLFEALRARGERFAVACHPAATIAPDVVIGEGCVICAGAVVNTGSVIGANVILNTSASVDHHNRVGDHAHIAPGVHLGGDVTIGAGTLVGIGATVMPQSTVGEWSVVAAAACVRRAVPDRTVVAGVPARPVRKL